MGIAAYYGYFAVNVLVKAFGYDSSDQIYKFFMLSGIMFLAIKLVTTKYTLREVIWCALLLGLGHGHLGCYKDGDAAVFVRHDHRDEGLQLPEADWEFLSGCAFLSRL